ncbi:hypothetical protein COU87_00430 [Candidatus Roizmanbacteria bacterium CG10_big_fil_rev_8_21_14_0_10_39_12]|uniref:Recombinase domain-containing protein n=1 Tax=Candidatus Roizmanbacteria bacterium CG10_big_fil_rev_8_21_14_0_10_39_12 TaxID=1974852 RepID=A0A2M8KQM9_9BACT|nr:MAG: hypothetical protein COY15_04270 [Candidatus Roizmanbacteria bacterium CG_4_10_14_0_2_um_filter_39_12]PJE62225.1 MAG: hypothetical protein COU87_00430 [Candidatus Roizmanbacteria bacterium CG10_big_fil_rev_8_21_14_0_10_39_12]
MNNLKYLIYCRKSSEEAGKQLQSLETQETMLLEYAKYNNLKIVDIIKEKKSAKNEYNRPLFTHMLERIKKGEANAILVIDPDRLMRNLIEGDKLIKLFETGSLKEIRTRHISYSSMESMINLIDEIASSTKYSRKLSIKVLDGNKTKLSKGEYPTYAPLGYINIPNTIIPDPERSHYIQEIFHLYSTLNYSLRVIANTMFEKGLRSRRGCKVSRSSINILLRNPEYTGVIRRKGIIYEGTHQPLVEKTEFQRVQDILDGKCTGKKRTHEFMYRGYLFCEVCGCQYTASLKKERYSYYYCTNGKGLCDQHKTYLPEDSAKKLIVNELKSVQIVNKELAELSFDLYADDLRKSVSNQSHSHYSIQKQISSIDQQLLTLDKYLLQSKIPQERYDITNKELEKDKKVLEKQLKELKPQDAETTLELVENIKSEAYNVTEMFNDGDDEVRSDLLKSLLWNLKVQNGKVASIQYKMPWNFIQKLNKSDDIETWRGTPSFDRLFFLNHLFIYEMFFV